VNAQDLGPSTRPANLNPDGINFQDCMSDMTLQFSVVACNFTGQNIQVWASLSSDCTRLSDRTGATAVCWPVTSGIAGVVANQRAMAIDLRVQDIVGLESQSALSGTYVRQGNEACYAQQNFVSTPIQLVFLPVDNSGNVVGSSYGYTFVADLVGPPAPGDVTVGGGDGSLYVEWAPNVDSDTAGYDLVIDPVPGQEADGGAPSGAPPIAAAAGACQDPLLTTLSTTDGGALVFEPFGDGGESVVESFAGGGAWIPPTSHIVFPGDSGWTVAGESNSQYPIPGLKNGTSYTVVVAAVDGSGNVGPPSAQVCDSPVARPSGNGTEGSRGGCALGTEGGPASPAALLAAAAVIGGAWRRRRARR
jgi:hypothetical protein